MEQLDIKSLYEEELKEKMISLGEKPFKGKQLYQWLHQKAAGSYEEMTNLSEGLRKKLTEQEPLTHLEVVEVQTSKIDGTQKYLFQLADGNVIESVWMQYKHGNSVCISSQVGCRMGCRFCASTIGGLTRNLLPSEMLDQVYRIQELTGERVSNVVVMGTGEPLDNYDNLIRFIRILSDEKGQNISQRNLTVSTCGLVPRIRQLAEEDLTITLALSLHAPNDEKRKELMPIAYKYSLSEVLPACKYYFEKTGRRLTFEYSLVGGKNDSQEDARQLAGLVHTLINISWPVIQNMAEKYHLELFINHGESGITQDWMFAYRSARTELMTIAHQDDTYDRLYTETVLQQLSAARHPLIAFTDYGELRNGAIVNKNTLLKVKRTMLLPLHLKIFHNSIFVRRRVLSFGCPICCPSVTFVKDNLPDQIFFPGFRSDEDWQAWELLSRKRGAFVYCNRILMYHRIHDGSETSAILGDSARGNEDFQMFCKFWPKPIARLLTRAYSSSEKSNELENK